jgi:glycosyltransferase involved in cell wall biosynthesis
VRTLLSINNYHYLRGGAETVFFAHNSLLREAGWTVVPFAMKHPRNLPSPYDEYFVDEIEFGEGYGLVGKLQRLPKVIYSFEARRKLDALLSATRPDVAHGHNIYHHLSPSILGLLRSRGIPTVLTLHDLKIACPAYNMLAADGVCERCRGGQLHNVVTRRCIKGSTALSGIAWFEAVLHRLLGSYTRSVDRFVVPSRFYIEKFASWGMERERFVHVPNFVDARAFAPSYDPGTRFLYFGRLSREKGLPTLIRAAGRAGVALDIAGTGPQEGELRQLAAATGATVSFLGHLGGQALHDAVRASRAVVLPSEWYENAPMSLLEAYALGKPVIGSAIAGIPELVREGLTGALFPAGDAVALSGVLRRFADAPAGDIAGWGRSARTWVEAEFSPARYRQRIDALYAGLATVNLAA